MENVDPKDLLFDLAKVCPTDLTIKTSEGRNKLEIWSDGHVSLSKKGINFLSSIPSDAYEVAIQDGHLHIRQK